MFALTSIPFKQWQCSGQVDHWGSFPRLITGIIFNDIKPGCWQRGDTELKGVLYRYSEKQRGLEEAQNYINFNA